MLANYIETGVALVVMFTLLVAAHEYGHYLFARMFNMGVEEFAIGFGRRPLLQWMHRTYQIRMLPGQVPAIEHGGVPKFDIEGGTPRPASDMVVLETASGKVLRETTRFTVRAWPLGGFVRIKGMLPENDGSETKIAGGFYSKPPWQRLLVLFAGPLFSVLAGVLILVPLYMVEGTQKPDNKPIIGEIVKDGPAWKAGLKEGDTVTAIDRKPIQTFYDVNAIVRDSADKRLDFSILRDGHPLSLIVVPEIDKDQEPSMVFAPGLKPTDQKRLQAKLLTKFRVMREPVGFVAALDTAVSQPIQLVVGLVSMVHHPAKIKDDVGGPISIGAVTYGAVQTGFGSVVELAALLSISIGVLNLLPVAPLDGGQMTLAFAELLRGGRRLSMQVQSYVGGLGLVFMCVLIVGVFCIDIGRLLPSPSHAKEPVPKAATK